MNKLYPLKLVTLSLLLFLFGGCSYLGFDKDNSTPPKPLMAISNNDPQKVTSFKSIWSADAGVGDAKQFLKLKSFVKTPYIYTVDANGLVESRDLVSGRLLWQNPLKVSISAGISGGPDSLYVTDEKGKLYALGLQDGAILWTYDFKKPVLNLSVYSAGKVFTQTSDGVLYALKAKDGKFDWSYKSNMPELSLYGSSRPAVWRDLVIAGFANGRLIAFNANNGNIQWDKTTAYSKGRSTLDRMVDIDASPLVYKNIVYAVSYQGNLIAVDLINGRKLWQKPISSYSDMTILNNTLYVTRANGEVTAIDRRDGHIKWNNNELLARDVSAPEAFDSASGTKVVVGDYQGYLHVLDGETGQIIGRTRVGSRGLRVAPNVYESMVYSINNDGGLFALKIG